MSFVRKYNGVAYEEIEPMVFDGKSWVKAKGFKFDGVFWTPINRERVSETWDSTWSQTYLADGTKREDYRGEMLCQGDYGGIMKSLCGFDSKAIQLSLANVEIEKIQLFLKNEHWYYKTGGTAVIGFHNHKDKPVSSLETTEDIYGALKQQYTARDQEQWIELPLTFAEALRNGDLSGINLYTDAVNPEQYGVFYGASSEHKPKLKITYKR